MGCVVLGCNLAYVIGVGAGSAYAQSPTKRAKPAKVPPPKSIHVQVYPAKDMTEVERLSVEMAVAGGVSVAGHWKVTSGDPKLKLPGGPAAAKTALAKADKNLKSARASVRQLELGKALKLSKEAVSLYSTYLHVLIKRDGNSSALVDAHVSIATVEYLNGKEEAASKALLHAFVLDPKLSYTPKRFPPQLQELVMQEKALFTNAGKGSVKVTLNSPGELYVNGVKQQPAPMKVGDLPAGPNLVAIVARGALPKVTVVQVEGSATKELALEVKSGKSQLTGPFVGSTEEVGEAPGPRLRKAAQAVGAEALIVVLPKVSDDRTSLVAYVYDMRSQTKVGRFDAAGEPEDIDGKAEKLGAEAASSAKWRLVGALTKGPPPVPLWKRLYKHKYFWHAAGTAAGVLFVTVVAVAASGMSPGKRVALFPSLVRF